MNTFSTILKLELLTLWRDRTFKTLFVILLLLTAYTICSSSLSYSHASEQHQELTDTARNKIVNQKPRSAHMAGHYGHIAFKPATFLQAIDPGVTAFTGTTVRLEAHVQNRDVFAPAESQSSLVRFGALSFSLLLQVVVPILLLFTCYRSVISARLDGTLKLLLCQGISLRELVTGKIMAYFCMFTGYLIVAFLVYGMVFSLSSQESSLSMLLRIIFICLLYALYYLLLISITVYFSARAKDVSGLLAGLIAGWFILTVIIPKASSNIGEQLAPLPSQMQVNESISAKKKLGINGHDKKNVYTIAFVDSILKKYKADSVQQLPFKIGGALMQADEDFNNKLYDEELSNIQDIIKKQNSVGSISSFIDPFMSIKNIAMGIAGTDVHHHFHFTESAEEYRRTLIRNLNAQDALRTSDYKDKNGKLTSSFWQQSTDFSYHVPSVGWSLKNYLIELSSLLFWGLLISSIIYFSTNKIKIQ